MTLLIFFSVVFATIVFSIVLERIIHCPILVGFAFFATFLIVAAVFNSTILVIAAIGLSILAFIVAFFDCVFRNSGFFRNNRCLRCDCDNDEEDGRSCERFGRNSGRCNCNCANSSDDTLTILNSNGQIVARINGNNITCNSNNNCNNNGCDCNNGCNNSGVGFVSENGNIALTDGNILTTADVNSSNCGCGGRNNRYRRC